MIYDPDEARRKLKINLSRGILEEQTVLTIAQECGREEAMKAILRDYSLNRGIYRSSGKDRMELLDEICTPEVFFEAKADKKLYKFSESLKQLRKRGFDRHLRPREFMWFMIADLENQLNPMQKRIKDDMIPKSEWLSLAFERNDDKLIAYIDPEGLEIETDIISVWGTSRRYSSYYNWWSSKNNFQFEDKREFTIRGIPSEEIVGLGDFGADFVKFLFGRPYNNLPKAMRKHYTNGGVSIKLPPSDGGCYSIEAHNKPGDNIKVNLSFEMYSSSRGAREEYK